MKFNELIHELECDYGRIGFRERLMLRRAYDVIPEKDEVEFDSITKTSGGLKVHYVNATTMICGNCGTPMIQQQYFGGGIYWLCGKCGATVERTGI